MHRVPAGLSVVSACVTPFCRVVYEQLVALFDRYPNEAAGHLDGEEVEILGFYQVHEVLFNAF